MIHKFFVVTKTSIYRVRDNSEDGYPEAMKIALKGKSKFSVGHKLEGGTMIAICNNLITYIPEGGGVTSQHMVKQRCIEGVNGYFWGDHTSPIVALFKDETSARACFESKDLKPVDPRWIEGTKAVLSEIGDEHPAFYVSHSDTALIQA